MSTPTVGFVALARPTFDVPYATEMAQRAWAQLQSEGFDLVGSPSLIQDITACEGAIALLSDQLVDLMILFQATFADSTMAMTLATACDAPILLWAVPEAHTGGRLRLNSFCGINLAAHALTRAKRPYATLYAPPDDPHARRQVMHHALAGKVSRTLRTVRLGRVGEHPAGFETCQYDPQRLRQTFGVEIVPLELDTDVFPAAQLISPDQIQSVRNQLDQKVSGLTTMDRVATDRTLSVYRTLHTLATEHSLAGLAVRCWPEFFTELGCAACGALSMLGDELTPCSCEADVNGTLTQVILQEISQEAAVGLDIVSWHEAEDAIVLWHCGLAPLSMADPRERPRVTIHSNRQLPLLMEFTLKPGRVTLARLSEASGSYQLVIGEGEMIAGPPSFSGTSGLWRPDRPAREVLDRLLSLGLEHHIALTYGDHSDILLALAANLDIPVIHLT